MLEILLSEKDLYLSIQETSMKFKGSIRKLTLLKSTLGLSGFAANSREKYFDLSSFTILLNSF